MALRCSGPSPTHRCHSIWCELHFEGAQVFADQKASAEHGAGAQNWIQATVCKAPKHTFKTNAEPNI